MKTIINDVTGNWKNVKNKCRTTVNKQYSEIEATSKFKNDLLISEHSPIRLINVDWSWKSIAYWLSTEWSRHKFEKFISTQRTDRTGIDRADIGQGAKVNFDGYSNAQSLIDAWRKRLCGCAATEAIVLARDFKIALHQFEPELADVLVPNCIYRCGCPEFSNKCYIWENFKENNPNIDMTNIRARYYAYNKSVYKKMVVQK